MTPASRIPAGRARRDAGVLPQRGRGSWVQTGSAAWSLLVAAACCDGLLVPRLLCRDSRRNRRALRRLLDGGLLDDGPRNLAEGLYSLTDRGRDVLNAIGLRNGWPGIVPEQHGDTLTSPAGGRSVPKEKP